MAEAPPRESASPARREDRPAPLVDAAHGRVSRAIFSDPEIYERELERIFRRCWLFVGHESSLPRPGSFIASYMGEDSVVVWRDARSKVRVYLNTCPHRGNKLCLYDGGRTPTLVCSYHGWSFNSEGRLVGVPFLDRAYGGELDRASNGLVEVPRVATYGGLIFACWDEAQAPLEDYLGDLRWYLDKLLFMESLGGLEVIPGCQKYMMAGNWKLVCENFTGDAYHVASSHASAMQVGVARGPLGQGRTGYFMAWLQPAHGLGWFLTDDSGYQSDLKQAERLGPEAVDYVTERYRRIQEGLREVAAKPYGWIHGNCFPNLNLQGMNSALRGHLLALAHPRGPHETEFWQWCLIERAAPRVVKELVARGVARGQSGAGMIGVDDSENFERIAENTRAPGSRRLTFNYTMGLGREGRWPGREEWAIDGLPGLIGPEFWETGQLHFYEHWATLMARA